MQSMDIEEENNGDEVVAPALIDAPPPPKLYEKLPRHSPFFIVNGGFTIFLTSTFIFGIKGAIVSLYHSSSTVHVYSGDVGYMWGLWVSTIVFFGVLLLMTIGGFQVGWHVDNINAYLFFVTGFFMHSIMAFVGCLGEDRFMCRYLYPVSRIRGIEAGVHCGLCAIQWITTMSFGVSLRWCRPHIIQHFLFGGSLFIGMTVALMYFALQGGVYESCSMYDRSARSRFPGGSVTLAVVLGVVPVAMVVVFIVEYFLTRRTPDGVDKGLNVETYKSKAGWVGWSRRGVHCAGVAIALLVVLITFGMGIFPPYLTWFLVTVNALGCIGPLVYWFRRPFVAGWNWIISEIFPSDKKGGGRKIEEEKRTASTGTNMWDMRMGNNSNSPTYATRNLARQLKPVGPGMAAAQWAKHKRSV